ncbi:gliding motility-associated C-terminal domain-containing protein [Paracrocinitomix mangrovi]|uniref:gliding motility-associated C-terminal domain-containing protein n=1 Tax=Paracrocinitomix mangrovi TaxID=2862509 RepID=UPI001C8D5BF6|nr:gliding motility-associated C-terminal domain-containing protein [Paracrocinitomix mangrovi]UKN02914.1 gliding motility-associated C-terminal domain-containing protein [Paracrocinitomix mangrovi]
MKGLFVILLFCTCRIWAQSTCNDYTAVYSTVGQYSQPTDQNCTLLCSPTGSFPWTGASCAGYIDVSFFNPQTSFTLFFGSVNDIDTATISIDGGGVMTITNAVNCTVNDSIVGGYNCNGTYGDVAFTVNSTQPFQNLYILNSGCSSGWILYCPEFSDPYAGEDTTVVLCKDSLLNVNDFIPGSTPGGVWTDMLSTGEFADSTGLLNLYNLDSGIYQFYYQVDGCGTFDDAYVTLHYGLDSTCYIDTTTQDTTVVEEPVDTVDHAVINAFSPNGDGVNDLLWINDLDLSKNNTVSIYNRWGDRVAFFQNYNNTDVYWDGKFGDREVSIGTYYYLLQYDSGEYNKGWIQVVK